MNDYVGKQIGHYRLTRLLGSGGFADVYLGEHVHLQAQAAVKILHMRFSHKYFESFQQEARIIARLHHPHIIRVLDFGMAQDATPYLVMDYAPGGTLRTRYPRGTRLPLEQVVMLVKQVASALQHAHEQQIVHRDIKPENMLLGAHDELLLSDFGLAVVQRASSSLSRQNQAGTPLYMAPEQLRGKPRPASDQYALAVVTYEWLCGEPPFRGSIFEVWSQHLYAQPPGLCERLPELPPAIEDAIFGALAKDPHERFTHVQEFAEVLETIYRASVSGTPLPFSYGSSLTPTPSPQEAFTSPATSSKHISPLGEVTENLEQPTSSPMLIPSHLDTVSHIPDPNRSRLLAKVRAFWIDGVLERSLFKKAPIALRLQEHPEALANPWHLVTQEPDHLPGATTEEVRISEWYDKAGGELLILGAPGSGKTTLLLELTRDLLSRAEMDTNFPLPVIFHLSSWAQHRQPLALWLIEELQDKYQVPLQLARTWIETDQILPLLDGLDEVMPTCRAACIDTINLYRREHGLLPLVLCSRSTDYFALGKRIALQKALVVQALTPEQVDTFLARAGAKLAHVRLALRNDPILQDLITTPLMVSLLTQAYQDRPIQDLLSEQTHEAQKRRLLDTYVKRALAYRGGHHAASPQHVVRSLHWLARQLKRRSQTVFYLEHLQPDWLNDGWSQQWYQLLAVNLPAILMGLLLSFVVPAVLFEGNNPYLGLIYAPIGGFLGLLLSETQFTSQRSEKPVMGRSKGWFSSPGRNALFQGGVVCLAIVIVGLWQWWESGPVGGLSFGLSSLLAYLLLRSSPKRSSQTIPMSVSRGHWWRHFLSSKPLRTGWLIGVSYGLSAGVVEAISEMNFYQQYYARMPGFGPHYGLYSGLFTGLFFGLLGEGLRIGALGGLLSALQTAGGEQIHLAEHIVWSWSNLRQGILTRKHASKALQVLVVIGVLIAISGWAENGLSEWIGAWMSHANASVQLSVQDLGSMLLHWLKDGLIAGLSIGFSYWLILGLFQGVSSTTIEDRHRSRPNQGIHQSGRNGLTLGLVGGAVCGLICCLALFLNIELNTILSWPSPLLAHCAPPVSVWQEIISLLPVSHSTGTVIAGCGIWTIPSPEPEYSFAQQLSFVLSIHLGEGLGIGLVNGVVMGLACGLLIAMLKGLLAWFQHGILRILLWRQRVISWKVTSFLDQAVERVLLQKVGGGYLFIHRLLLDHFASLESASTSDTVPEQSVPFSQN
jgi:serine/threonine protein kinase